MDGQQLYETYRRELRVIGNGYNVLSVTQMHGTPAPEPVDYQRLPPRAKAFWQRLAQRVEADCPREHGTLNLRSGRYTP